MIFFFSSDFLLSHIDCTERLWALKDSTREMFERDWALTVASRRACDEENVEARKILSVHFAQGYFRIWRELAKSFQQLKEYLNM